MWRFAYRDGARDVGCAIVILSARIYQINFAIAQHSVAGFINAVMGQSRVGACSGNGIKGYFLEFTAHGFCIFFADGFQFLGCVNFRDCSRCLPIKPRQEFDHGDTIANVRVASAFKFRLVFHGARQDDRISALDDGTFRSLDDIHKCHGHAIHVT